MDVIIVTRSAASLKTYLGRGIGKGLNQMRVNKYLPDRTVVRE